MSPRVTFKLLGALALFGLLGVLPVLAGEEHPDVRRLHERGEIRSLEAVIRQARKEVPGGRLVEAELEREGGRLVYEVELIDREGVLRELYYDAQSGQRITGAEAGEKEEHR